MKNPAVAGALALSLACGALVSAEPPDTLGRVKLVTRPRNPSDLPGEVVGDLLGSGPDTLTVRTARGEVVVKRSDLWRIERSLGPRPRDSSIGRGTMIGLGGGALVGGAVGFALGDEPRGIPTSPCLGCGHPALDDYRSRKDSAVRHAAIGALIGGVAGAIYGATTSGEVWRREKPDGTVVSLAVQPEGIEARFTLRF